MAAIVAATAAAGVRPRVIRHRAATAAGRRTGAGPRTAAEGRTVAAVAADMEGKNTLDCFPA